MTNILSKGREPTFVYFLKGGVFKSLGKAEKHFGVHRATITRWCDNPRVKDCWREKIDGSEIEDVEPESKQRPIIKKEKATVKPEPKPEAPQIQPGKEDKTPLEYLVSVMNDPSVDEKIRLQAANWAAPYLHPKASTTKGKKEEREERAKQAGSGRFSASHPPKLKALK